MTCSNAMPLHVGFVYELENGYPSKFWCVREMKALKVSISKKDKLLKSFNLGDWYTANLNNNCFMKVSGEFKTRIFKNRLEIQAPLITFYDPEPHGIAYVPGLGKVAAFIAPKDSSRNFERYWITKVDALIKPKTAYEACQKQGIEWAVRPQKSEKLELVDLITCRHLKVSSGIIISIQEPTPDNATAPSKIQIWNEQVGLCEKFMEKEKFAIGTWVKFISIDDFSGRKIAANLLEIKEPVGYDTVLIEDGVYIKLDLHLVQKTPRRENFYVKNIGELEDPRGFLSNVPMSNGNLGRVAIINFDMEAKLWAIKNVIDLRLIALPIHMIVSTRDHQLMIPPAIPISEDVKVIPKQKLYVKVPKTVKTNVYVPTAFIPPSCSSEAIDKLVSEELNEDAPQKLQGPKSLRPQALFLSKSTKSEQLSLEILLYKVYLYHVKQDNKTEVPKEPYDFFMWLKADLGVSEFEDELCLQVWKYWNKFLTLEEDEEVFEMFMERVKNEFNQGNDEDDKENEDPRSTSISQDLSREKAEYNTLGLLLRKLYLFEKEGYEVPHTEEAYLDWLHKSCDGGLTEQFCFRSWKMWKLLKLASHDDDFRRKLEAEIDE